MIEKLLSLLPQVGIVAVVALASRIFYQMKMKKYSEQIKSVDWVKENQSKFVLFFAFMATFWAPTAEEILFRLPLLIAFDSLSSTAWLFIVIQALIFGLMHDKKYEADIGQIYKKRETGEASDNLIDEVNQHKKKNPISLRVVGVTARTILGVIAGYLVIRYQSLFLVVGVHFAWNILVLPIMILVVIVLSVVYYLFLRVQSQIELYQSRRRMKKSLEDVGRLFYP